MGELGKQWTKQSEETKAQIQMLVEKDKERYRKELEEYQASQKNKVKNIGKEAPPKIEQNISAPSKCLLFNDEVAEEEMNICDNLEEGKNACNKVNCHQTTIAFLKKRYSDRSTNNS